MVRLLPAGDTALVVEFGNTIDRALNARVIALADRIARAAIEGVVEVVPTFRSLMVHYDPVKLLYSEIEALVAALAAGLEAVRHVARLWTIPTCYGGEFGPDLEEVAAAVRLSPAEVVALHSAGTYHVYCLGFLPGWPYLGDLTERLALPRRQSPRVKVPMGAVCIAQRMTGIYPLESPGGWHLIGRTPVRMFDPRRPDPVLLSPGDQVRYTAIGLDEFARLEALALAGTLAAASEPVET